MRVAGGFTVRRYINEEFVWVEPQNMPQALYLQLLGIFYEKTTGGKKDESGNVTGEFPGI